MRRSMTYGMMVLFLLFMITANPSGTGESGRNFVSWLAGGWDDTREFVGEFVGDETADTNELGEIPIATVEPEPDRVPETDDTSGEPIAPASG